MNGGDTPREHARYSFSPSRARYGWATVEEFERFGNNALLAADPVTGNIRRFLVGCRGQEVTGCIATPDTRTLFINLQHPGEGSEEHPILTSH